MHTGLNSFFNKLNSSKLSGIGFYAIFLIYSILIFVMSVNHEPWFDEAQAWLLVRDLSLNDLIWNYLRYEGHPSLWYLIISIVIKLNLPYFALNIVSASIACFSTAVFLRFSPFPLYIKAVIPFTYFIFFQYAVISRSYVLLAPILFLIATIYPKKDSKLLLYTILLVLLSHASLHGFVIALSLVVIYILDTMDDWANYDNQQRRALIAALLFFLISALFLFFQLRFPSDLLIAGGLGSKNPILFVRDSLTENNLLAIVVFGSTILWLEKKKLLLVYLIPLIGLSIVFSVVFKPWHEGIYFLLWVFVLWLSFEKNADETNIGNSYRLARFAIITSILVVSAIQINWSAHSFDSEIKQDYSGAMGAAYYLKQNVPENSKIITLGYHGLGVLPYFNRNIFANYNEGKSPSFWRWSKNNSLYWEVAYLGNWQRYSDEIDEYDPDVILVALRMNNLEEWLKFFSQREHYELTAYFRGNMFWKNREGENSSFLIFRKKI